jgi:putative aminopeptidase FrvX
MKAITSRTGMKNVVEIGEWDEITITQDNFQIVRKDTPRDMGYLDQTEPTHKIKSIEFQPEPTIKSY